MNLFEIEETPVEDWFAVCPNADDPLPDDTNLRIFNLAKLYLEEYNRLAVYEALLSASGSTFGIISTLNESLPNNHGILFAARELVHKAPYYLLCSVLALSHDGSGYHRVRFQDRTHQPPLSLLKAFGLRGSESKWVERLAGNESFVWMVAGNIKKEDWNVIPLDKTTLLKTEPKRNTASQSLSHWGVNL